MVLLALTLLVLVLWDCTRCNIKVTHFHGIYRYMGHYDISVHEGAVHSLAGLKGHKWTGSIVVKSVKIFKSEKVLEIQPVRLTEVCGKI